MYSRLFPYFWPVWNRRWGWVYLCSRRALKRQEQMDEQTMRRFQWERLKQLLDHAAAHVPFYRRRFDEADVQPSTIQGPESFRRIPVLTRRDLQQNLDDLVATNYDRSTLHRNETGGSTGNPVVFYESDEYRGYQRAVKQRARSWAGFAEGQKMAVIWGADRDLPTLSWLARQRLHHVVRMRWLNSYSLTAEKMEEFARLLIRWKPRYILAYARALYLFASFLRDRRLDRIRPFSIETSAETLWGHQRELIEDVFKCRVFNFYGARDVPSIAGECEMHRGLHVFSDNVYLELLRDGRPAEPGEAGEIIVTPLTQMATPLIRYQIGDLARASEEKCPCGRPFPLLTEVLGRSNDVLTTPDGTIVHGAFFNHLFFGLVEGVQEFQVYQRSVNDVTISIQSRTGLPDGTLRMLRDKVIDHMGPGVEVSLKLVDAIPPTSTGKHRYMISEVQPSFVSGRGRPAPVDQNTGAGEEA